MLVEESLVGWDEFELEVMRDAKDNVVVVCSIENLDPMGVHTGDSVTVAPQMTLSDEAYQELRDAAARVIRAVGVETGGSNIQFARERETGELRVIEMNPRVSRSSALASKATGYPIAKVAAKLAVGYTLDEIPNDLTGTTPASFEPTLDYVVVKFPRFAFEKFPGADEDARHADEVGRRGDGHRAHVHRGVPEGDALPRARPGAPTPWPTLDDLPDGAAPLVPGRARASASGAAAVRRSSTTWSPTTGFASSGSGWSDADVARPVGHERGARAGALAGQRACGRSTAASTRARPRSRRARTTCTRPGARTTSPVGPRSGRRSSSSARARTGSARESSSTTAASTRRGTFRALGYETVMVNCNPETVSTDYDTSDRLYFEPLAPRRCSRSATASGRRAS